MRSRSRLRTCRTVAITADATSDVSDSPTTDTSPCPGRACETVSVWAPNRCNGTVISKVQALSSSRMGGSEVMPCERKTRRRSTTSPAGPTRGNSAVQRSPPCPPPEGEGATSTRSLTQTGEKIQGRQVPLEAETGDHGFCRGRGNHPMPVRFAGENIGDVHLDDRFSRASQRVRQPEAVMGQRSRIDEDGVTLGAFFLDPIDELTLVV